MPGQKKQHKWRPRAQSSHRHSTRTLLTRRTILSPCKTKTMWHCSIHWYWGYCSKKRDYKRVPGRCGLSRASCDQCPTWERMLVHCCSKDTGGFPRLVASWTLSSCSFWVRLSCRAWAKATAAHQLDKESAEKRPPHSSCPAEMEFAVRKE